MQTEVEGKVAAVRTALQGTESGSIQAAVDELNASMQKIGQAVYGAGEGAPGAGPDGEPGEEAPEGTVEGEFREV